MAMARTVGLVVAGVALLTLSGVASAQTDLFGLKVEGDVDLSGRIYLDRPPKEDRAKLEEYRDLSEQPFGAFRFRLSTPDEKYSTEVSGLNVGQEDQQFSLFADRPGLWNFKFDWNQIPHLFSTDSRLLDTEPATGVFVLPTPRPPLSAYNSAPVLDEIRTRWDVGRFAFTLTPTPETDLDLEYTRIKKDGDRPFSMAFGSPGNGFAQILKPIDETIHDFRIRGSWVGDGWQVQAGYTLSIYDNANTAVVADNPCFKQTQCGTDATGAPARGQISLAPSNSAHTVSLSGAVNLPMRTRVIANTSYSLRLQNDDFLPHTVNPSISSPLLALPRKSLDGEVGVFLFNVNATSRPLSPLTLTGKYRLFDYNDMTPEITFPAFVLNDRTLDVGSRTTGAYDYTKHNADLDARWRFGLPLALTIGGGWERWDRGKHREVPTSDEYFGRAKLDWTPADWALVRLAYLPSFRRISEYNTFAHLAHTVIEEDLASATSQSQSVLLRKFDEADRDRQRVDLMVQLSPTDVVTITPTVSYRYDDYYNTPLGLQKSEDWSAGVDFGWTPADWLTVTAGYVYERIDQRMRSTNRDVVGTTVTNFPDYDWVSNNVDTVHTVHVGASATLIPKKLDWTVDLSYETATGEVKTFNPVTPTSGTATTRANATARPFPDITDTLLHIESSLRYRFSKAWTAGLSYIFEKFDETDFRSDGLTPFVPGVTSIFLGSDVRDYTAHILVLSVGYHF